MAYTQLPGGACLVGAPTGVTLAAFGSVVTKPDPAVGGGSVTLVVSTTRQSDTALTVSLNQAHMLMASDAGHGVGSSQISLIQLAIVDPPGNLSAHSASEPLLTQSHILSSDIAAHDLASLAMQVSENAVLYVAAADHGHLSGAALLQQLQTLDADAAWHQSQGTLVGALPFMSAAIAAEARTNSPARPRVAAPPKPLQVTIARK